MNAFITTHDPKRLAKWLHLFGTETLPVLDGVARKQLIYGRRVLAYDLLIGQLSQAQRNRFAGHVHLRTKRPYDEVRAEMNGASSWPIKAAGCVAVVEEDRATDEERPLPFLLHMFAREHEVERLWCIAT